MANSAAKYQQLKLANNRASAFTFAQILKGYEMARWFIAPGYCCLFA
jgi:hypothetical protein